KAEKKSEPRIEDKNEKDEWSSKGSLDSCSNTVLQCIDSSDFCSNIVLPCIDKLREELACAICLEICFEPSTTPCGHSFCKKCLCSAADKYGKRCLTCRQLISNGRSCTVNTILWNTIQLLFPQEKAAAVTSNSQERATKNKSPIRNNHGNDNQHKHIRFLRESDQGEGSSNGKPRRLRNGSLRNRSTRASRHSSRDVSERRRAEMPEQDVDAALASGCREKSSCKAFANTDEPERLHSTKANLRAIVSRAMTIVISFFDNIVFFLVFLNVHSKDDEAKLVQIEELKGRNIFILISNLDLKDEILSDIYHKENKPESQYEVAWFPIVNWSMLRDEATLK
ncbi:LOW QUALITY PROTEIN: Zinc finger, C3HC4 RING-type, partial [Dillenia turbinata]